MSSHSSETHSAYISIGSNATNKVEKVKSALEQLSEIFGSTESSDIYETPCFHNISEDYANAVARIETECQREEVELLLKDIETRNGRNKRNEQANIIELDLDLVMWDDAILRQKDYGREYFSRGYRQLLNPRAINIKDYIYNLPEDRIALYPLPKRDSCKLLVVDKGAIISDTCFFEIEKFLPRNSILIYNDTKVINARLPFEKETGAKIEIFCLEPYSPKDYQLNFSSTQPVQWKCLVGNSKKWINGTLHKTIVFNDEKITLEARRLGKDAQGSLIEFTFRGENEHSLSEIISMFGNIPIPPYLNRESEVSDKENYQTVYSHIEGSVAAPTAGLHFTEELLNELKNNGIQIRNITLHVGAGTFQPVKSEHIGEHNMHAELIDVDKGLIKELAETQKPITAVGTTTVRTLESLYHIGCLIGKKQWHGTLDQWYPYGSDHPKFTKKDALQAIVDYLEEKSLNRLIADTQIIIAPGYKFRIVDNLITNFHQPGSTLLLLIAAIVGKTWKKIYEYALSNDYRFLSYGDSCLFLGLK